MAIFNSYVSLPEGKSSQFGKKRNTWATLLLLGDIATGFMAAQALALCRQSCSIKMSVDVCWWFHFSNIFNFQISDKWFQFSHFPCSHQAPDVLLAMAFFCLPCRMQVAMNTTIAAASGGISVFVIRYVIKKKYVPRTSL
jgi:hypothetical protein